MGDEERTEQRAARDALEHNIERAMFHLKAAAEMSGHREELRSGLEDARRAAAALAKEASLGRVYASTGAERDAAAPGNLVVGVTAHCACGRVFTDDVRCCFADSHSGAVAPPQPSAGDDEDRASLAAWGDPEGFRGSDY